jgi:hypothetical protein
MNARTTRRLGAALITALGALGCEPLVDVNVTLVEPCDQRDQALNGVETFEITHNGPGETNTVTKTNAGGGEPLFMRQLAEDVVVTVKGFEGNADVDGAQVTSGDPKSLGRSMPLDIAADTQDLDLVINMGRLDGFGQPTDVDGSCGYLKNGNDSVSGRHGHQATFVRGSNKVLITGGAVWTEQDGSRGEAFLKSAELYDPATGTFEPIAEMPNTRAYHSATSLPDGRVLLVGGLGVIDGDIQSLSAGLIYDPSRPNDDPWEVKFFRDARALHTATLLEDALIVVVAGGCAGQGCRPGAVTDPGDGDPTSAPKLTNSIEVYDISEDNVVAMPGQMATTRALHAASALEGGRLLVSGGVNASGIVCDVEIYQASGTTVSRLPFDGNLVLPTCLTMHSQVTLNRERVMFIGGRTQANGGVPDGPGTDQVYFWNTLGGVETTSTAMLSGRFGHQAFLLDSGNVLVVGGEIPDGGASAERLAPLGGDAFGPEPLAGPPLEVSRLRFGAAHLPTNQVLITGGHTSGQVTTDDTDIYYGD